MKLSMVIQLVMLAMLVLAMFRYKLFPGMMNITIFDSTSYGTIGLLNAKMRLEQWWGNKFAEFVAPNFVKRVGKEVEVRLPGEPPAFTGAPVEIFEQFQSQGQMDMRIPVALRLTGMPVHGDRPLKGNEEAQIVAWRTVKINRTRKAVSKPTGMSRQLTKGYADSLVTDAANRITEWWGQDYHPGNFILSILAGASRDLIFPAIAGGRAINVMSHPNFLCAGSGLVSYSGGRPGVAGYEASIEAAVNGLTNTASDYFSCSLIRNAVAEAYRLKIKPIILKGGTQFYPIFCSDAQIMQLRTDSEYKDWLKRMPEELSKHPFAAAAEIYIGGALVIPDLKMWGVRTNADDGNVTAGTVAYGPAATTAQVNAGWLVGNWINSLDTSNKKCAILMGASALSVGVGERLALKEDVEDYENVKGIGIDTIQSIVRTDIFDEDGKVPGLTAGDFFANNSSMVIATYSKHSLDYT
jgi:hypothetical protein